MGEIHLIDSQTSQIGPMMPPRRVLPGIVLEWFPAKNGSSTWVARYLHVESEGRRKVLGVDPWLW